MKASRLVLALHLLVIVASSSPSDFTRGGSADSSSRRKVPAAHLVHQVSTARLRKIQKHNPILSPYHPNHYDDPVLDAAPRTLSLSPADLGGDPTGQRDSTWAVQAAVEVCWQQQAMHDPNKTAAGAGMCEVNLGGVYKISSPIITPKGMENFIFGFGALTAGVNWTAPTSGPMYGVHMHPWS